MPKANGSRDLSGFRENSLFSLKFWALHKTHLPFYPFLPATRQWSERLLAHENAPSHFVSVSLPFAFTPSGFFPQKAELPIFPTGSEPTGTGVAKLFSVLKRC
jgi:hypothetical protein